MYLLLFLFFFSLSISSSVWKRGPWVRHGRVKPLLPWRTESLMQRALEEEQALQDDLGQSLALHAVSFHHTGQLPPPPSHVHYHLLPARHWAASHGVTLHLHWVLNDLALIAGRAVLQARQRLLEEPQSADCGRAEVLALSIKELEANITESVLLITMSMIMLSKNDSFDMLYSVSWSIWLGLQWIHDSKN